MDRFYLGKVGTGILKLITFGGLGIWALVDLILVLANKTRDKRGLPLEGYDQYKKMALIVTLALFVLSIIFNSARGASAPLPSPADSAANDSVEVPAATASAEIVAQDAEAEADQEKAAAEASKKDEADAAQEKVAAEKA